MLTIATIATAALLALVLAACIAAAVPRRVPVNRDAHHRAQDEWRTHRNPERTLR